MRSRRSFVPLFFIVLVTTAFFACAPTAYAEWFLPEVRLTTNTADQMSSRISGAKIVYSDQRNGNWDVYLYDLATGTEKRLTTDAADQSNPAISGTRVVYEDRRNGNWDIYLYDLATDTEKRVTVNTGDQIAPAISGTRIVYEDWRSGPDIYLYDLATNATKRLSTSHRAHTPEISGAKVVYLDLRDENDIYLYDIATSTEKRLSPDGSDQGDPTISGTRVVYSDTRSGNSDIYLYDLATNSEKRLTTNDADQYHPTISGTRVVYDDDRSGNSDVYLYDLAAGIEKRLTTNGADQDLPRIDGSRVVFVDSRHGNDDLYLTELAVPKLSADTPATVGYGTVTQVSGTLTTATGAALVDRTVTLSSSSNSVLWIVQSELQTGAEGAFSFDTPALTKACYFRVNCAGDTDYPGVASGRLLVKPKVYLTTPHAPASLDARTLSTAYGYLKPRHSAGTYPVTLRFYHYERLASGAYRYVLRQSVSARVSDYSTYSKYQAAFSVTAKGKWQVCAYHPAEQAYAATYSEWRSFSVD